METKVYRYLNHDIIGNIGLFQDDIVLILSCRVDNTYQSGLCVEIMSSELEIKELDSSFLVNNDYYKKDIDISEFEEKVRINKLKIACES